MLDRAILGTSWDSVVSSGGCGVRIEDCGDGGSTRSSPEPSSQPEHFCISRHNPNRTFRRENVIASWRSVKREREQALGKRSVHVPADLYRDYYGRQAQRQQLTGRSKVKRCRSERTPAPSAAAADVQRKVKRTYSVLYRYDPSEERVVKEYKYLKATEAGGDAALAPALLQRACSEPPMPAPPAPTNKTGKKARRSLTAFLTLKTKLLNIFTSKS